MQVAAGIGGEGDIWSSRGPCVQEAHDASFAAGGGGKLGNLQKPIEVLLAGMWGDHARG
jgi:hypothetical protein